MKIFKAVLIFVFLISVSAFAADYSVDFTQTQGIVITNEPGQYQLNNVLVKISDNEARRFNVVFEWSYDQNVLIPIKATEIFKPIVLKACDNAFYRMLYKDRCVNWVGPSFDDLNDDQTCGNGYYYNPKTHECVKVISACGRTIINGDPEFCFQCRPNGCLKDEGRCNNSSQCAAGLYCDQKTHICKNPEPESNSDWTCPFPLGHHSYCAVCEKNDANKDGTDGCDVGEGWCAPNRGYCAKGLICDPKTHKCVKNL